MKIPTEFDKQIPGSKYVEEDGEKAIAVEGGDLSLNYRVEIEGMEAGEFTFLMLITDAHKREITTIEYRNTGVSEGDV